MRTHSHVKVRGPTRVNAQQVIFELKHKVILALNKLADRDTHQRGVDDLEKTVECLTPDGVTPFLSCILDTDSEQKSAVRKECIRLMATIATFHEGLIVPHLGKMIASIVKRLKDPDSIVRDACVETVGVLATKLSKHGDENHGVFVVLVKPLFEALGEQNKQVQSGSAFCLARIIDNTNDPPLSVLQRMLIRTIKLLKNPHFMGKPAIVELNRSIIQAGGAPTQNSLSTAIAGIQEALKNKEWTTRKAASVALGDIAASGGCYLAFLRASCICSLESCRFDKVKPVRDTVLQALQYWKSLSGPDTCEPSETGSSIKDSLCEGDYSDLSSTTESGQKNVTLLKVGKESTKGRIPLSVRKTCHNYVENPSHPKPDDWHVEIALPKKHAASVADCQNEESEGSSVTKILERMSIDVTSMQDSGYRYVQLDDKQECSSVSNLALDNSKTKFVDVSHDCLEKNGLMNPLSQQFGGEEISSDGQVYTAKMRDRISLDSTVTESCSQTSHGFCMQIANEMVCIQKQLLQIETKQTNLMDQIQVFTNGIMDSLSAIHSRMIGLEHVVDSLTQDLENGGRYSDLARSNLLKQNQSVPSPRLSACTPRSSIDIQNRQTSLLSVKSSEIWEEKALLRSRLSSSARQDTGTWMNTKVKSTRNPSGKEILKSFQQGTLSKDSALIRKNNGVFSPASSANTRQSGSESKGSSWKRIKGFLCEGDLDSAYKGALSSGDELVLIELLDRTGPVLKSLLPKTVSDLLSTLASYLREGRFLNSIIPWLQQVVDMSMVHGTNCIFLSAKVRKEIVSAIQEVVNLKFTSPAERRSGIQLSTKLHHIWGNCS
ncbi:microtubule-associated protein TORTIFOLIA1 [Quillaja saponaria]|uniref:Microtubule-associated protein TORTIFOLIA1 n=1 Tax=Quillaja saponaria TaxID=32244 RepID=A0AAD7Q2G5_QUISA|nr:microtubule-associated protein TORTIFOLIA1 [Quillaja saponaria]KAJ7973668.1 microtubule-associated protein TORTIFOLIA1 [Quillaja saponaria]